MKTLLSIIAILLTGLAVQAQSCTELFFSEYCEGSGNNKGVEIYNPTANPIDLSAYTVQRYSNGAQSASDETGLVGTIPAYGTWVLVNGQTEDVDLGGGNTSPAVDPNMQALANQLDNPYPAPTYMNGNDAIILLKNDAVIVDIIGKPGEDPGTAWTDNADAGYTSSDGGTWLTANKTLRRKFYIEQGVTTVPVQFYALAEWDSLPSNTWDGLGSHACACDPTSVPELNIPVEFTVYPNPSVDGKFHVNANLNIAKIELYDQAGRMVKEEIFDANVRSAAIFTDELETGVYVLNAYLEGRKTFSQRVVVR